MDPNNFGCKVYNACRELKIEHVEQIIEHFGLTPENMIEKLNIRKVKFIPNYTVVHLLCFQKSDGVKFKEPLAVVEHTSKTEYVIPKGYDFYNYFQIYNVPSGKIYKIELIIGDQTYGKQVGDKVYFSELINGTPSEVIPSGERKLRITFDPYYRDYIRVDLSAALVSPELYDVYCHFPSIAKRQIKF